MQKSAVIVHLDGIAAVTPLVGGYLKAYALADPVVRSSWEIELWSESSQVKASTVIRALVDRAPDLVAFSVYTWNAGLVRRLLPALRGLLPPRTRFLLGGVEVMNVAPRYVRPEWEDVVVCNGEGERTFRRLLLELGEERPDLARVGGITLPRDGEWLSTEGPPRIQDLAELESPWLSGVFDDLPRKEVALFETNRGCPFACEFCYWGGAVGQKIYQQDLERIRDELTWIAKSGIRALSICDANFGILPRDAEIARHIVAVKQAHGGPTRLVFNSSKVRPERVEEVSRIFFDADLLTRHVFSLQSMDAGVLARAKRTSLEREPYREIQQRLNERRMPSLIELLWPMPGETLESFKDGVDDLCGLGAQGFLIYPLIWLNNTGYREHTAEYGVTLLPEDDPAGGGEIVVRTAEVTFAEYLEGLRFSLALFLLHDCRGLYATLQILHRLGITRFRDALDAFARFMEERAEGPFAELWRGRVECFEDMAKYTWRGMLADAALNSRRKELDLLLAEFAAEQRAWFEHERGDLIRAAFELDLLCRPYAFLQTRCELGVELEHVEILEGRQRFWCVRSPYDVPALIAAIRAGDPLDAADLQRGDFEIRIDHKGFQLFLLPTRTEEEHHWLCTHAVQEIARIEPRCTTEPRAVRAMP